MASEYIICMCLAHTQEEGEAIFEILEDHFRPKLVEIMERPEALLHHDHGSIS